MNLLSETTSTKPLQWKKMILSTLLSGVTMWVVAGLWHTIIAIHYYKNETDADHEGIGIIAIAYIILAFFMSYLYQTSCKKKTIWEGLFFGGLIGVLWVFPHELAMAGAHSEPIPYVFKNAIWHLFEQSIGGFVVSLVYIFPKKKE